MHISCLFRPAFYDSICFIADWGFNTAGGRGGVSYSDNSDLVLGILSADITVI